MALPRKGGKLIKQLHNGAALTTPLLSAAIARPYLPDVTITSTSSSKPAEDIETGGENDSSTTAEQQRDLRLSTEQKRMDDTLFLVVSRESQHQIVGRLLLSMLLTFFFTSALRSYLLSSTSTTEFESRAIIIERASFGYVFAMAFVVSCGIFTSTYVYQTMEAFFLLGLTFASSMGFAAWGLTNYGVFCTIFGGTDIAVLAFLLTYLYFKEVVWWRTKACSLAHAGVALVLWLSHLVPDEERSTFFKVLRCTVLAYLVTYFIIYSMFITEQAAVPSDEQLGHRRLIYLWIYVWWWNIVLYFSLAVFPLPLQ